MTGLICDYVASYRDGHIDAEKFREDLSNPEIVLQEDLADFILDAFDRRLLAGIPDAGYYDRIQTKKKPAFIPHYNQPGTQTKKSRTSSPKTSA